jgi:hypothetical protein
MLAIIHKEELILKRLYAKWVSFSLVVAMLIALLPPMTAYAAAAIQITNLYTNVGPITVSNDASVQRFTTNGITLNALISGFTDDMIQDIYYEVYNVNTGLTNQNTTNKAIKDPNNPNQITFNNVQLTSGLNKITIKYGTNGTVSSIPGWAYFSPVTNISNLQIAGATFLPKGMYPSSAPYSNISITGKANNASEVDAILNGNGTVYPASSLVNGNFTFITNSGRPSDMSFNPGDNILTLIAKNQGYTYTTDIPFTYDNGEAFAYNGQIEAIGTTPFQPLVPVPTINPKSSAASDLNVNLTASIKNPLISSTVTKYTYLDVTVTGVPTFKLHYDFSAISGTTVGSTVPGALSPTSQLNGGAAPTESLTLSNIASAYNQYDFSGSLPVNTGVTAQEVVFTFGTASGLTSVSKFQFYFVDKNSPYIDHITQVFVDPSTNNSYEVLISPSGVAQISQFPAQLRIYSTSNTKAIDLQINGTSYVDTASPPAGSPIRNDYDSTNKQYKTTPTSVIDPNTGKVYTDSSGNPMNETTITLQGIPDGAAVVSVLPYPALGSSTPYQAGIKNYSFQFSSTPYVTASNFYSGMVLSQAANLTCPYSSSAPCLTGRINNLPYSELANVKISVNDIPLPISVDASNSTITSGANKVIFGDGSFVLSDANLGLASGSPNSLQTLFATDGKKTIKFSLYLGGKLVTVSTYDIIVLSDATPMVSKLIPTPSNLFTNGTTPGTYVTNNNVVQLSGTLNNVAVAAATLSVTVPGSTTPKTPGIVISGTRTPDPTDPTNPNKFSENFTLTSPFCLTDGVYDTITQTCTGNNIYGDYTFKVMATAPSGVSTTYAITVTLQPVPYIILSPQPIYKNNAGVDQADINANFQKIVIQADQADSVTFGKDSAVQIAPNKFQYEVTNVKPGLNTVKFTITRGKSTTNGTLILNNENALLVGAQYKTKMATKITAFNGNVILSFPKDTKLVRNDTSAPNQFATTDRSILMGIADLNDGRVVKTGNVESMIGMNYMIEPTGRFRAASPRYWIDAGAIPLTSAAVGGCTTWKDPTVDANALKAVLNGSGSLPNSTDPCDIPFYARNILDQVVPTNRGTLTLSYDPSIAQDAAKYVTVYQLTTFYDMGGTGNQRVEWRNIGGVVDAKKNTITVNIDSFGYFQVMYMNNSFNDVTGHPYARDDLDTLYSKGYMYNAVPNLFLADDPITRGEFVTMAVKVFGIPLENRNTTPGGNNIYTTSGTFGDVRRGTGSSTGSLYDFMSIEAAARAGIIRGKANGVFGPQDPITREEAAVIIARAAELKVSTDNKASLQNLTKTFQDGADVDYYAAPSVEAITKAKLIEGSPYTIPGQKKPVLRFNPKDNLSRADAGIIMVRVLRQQKKL